MRIIIIGVKAKPFSLCTHSLPVDVLYVHIHVLVVVAHEQTQALWVAIHSCGTQKHTHARE